MATGIEWCDETINPVVGCSHASPGCDHCYAERMAWRLAHHPDDEIRGRYALVVADAGWNGQVHFCPGELRKPLQWTKARRVFVCSMGDLFHPDVPDAWVDAVFSIMAATPRHTYQVLTKRADRMLAYALRVQASQPHDPVNIAVFDLANTMSGAFARWPLPNVGLGITVEDDEHYLQRMQYFTVTPAAWRFLSIEPCLGDIRLQLLPDGRNCIICGDSGHQLCDGGQTIKEYMDAPGLNIERCLFIEGRRAIDWVIVGGETGAGARFLPSDRVRSLRDQCTAAGVPFFFKGWGAYLPDDQNPKIGYGSGGVKMQKPGRVLDGVTWSEFPGTDLPA
ncbi:MAG: phage Gp37/Gp68 family protein [Armatimonadota bacterium]